MFWLVKLRTVFSISIGRERAPRVSLHRVNMNHRVYSMMESLMIGCDPSVAWFHDHYIPPLCVSRVFKVQSASSVFKGNNASLSPSGGKSDHARLMTLAIENELLSDSKVSDAISLHLTPHLQENYNDFFINQHKIYRPYPEKQASPPPEIRSNWSTLDHLVLEPSCWIRASPGRSRYERVFFTT